MCVGGEGAALTQSGATLSSYIGAYPHPDCWEVMKHQRSCKIAKAVINEVAKETKGKDTKPKREGAKCAT